MPSTCRRCSSAARRSPQTVEGALDDSGLAPGQLELEITEAVLLGDNETTLGVLSQLRDLGVRIAMDDFGTGYSSLSYLQNFHVDKIKIDRSFVTAAVSDAGSLNIVRAVTAMAKGLGMATTAEGVETAEQLEIARAEGCTEVQGFLLGRPVPADEIEAVLLGERIFGHGERCAGASAARRGWPLRRPCATTGRADGARLEARIPCIMALSSASRAMRFDKRAQSV